MKITIEVEGMPFYMELFKPTMNFVMRLLRRRFPARPINSWAADPMSLETLKEGHWRYSYDTDDARAEIKPRKPA